MSSILRNSLYSRAFTSGSLCICINCFLLHIPRAVLRCFLTSRKIADISLFEDNRVDNPTLLLNININEINQLVVLSNNFNKEIEMSNKIRYLNNIFGN